MSFFEVTSGEIKSKANELSQYNQQFKSKAGELTEKEGSLISMWEGAAKDSFHQAYMHDQGQMDIFSQLIDKYVEALYMIAQKYEEAERKAVELATARNY